MHPAHPLAPQRVTMGAGVSNNFVLGEADESIEIARQTTIPGAREPADQQRFAEGAIVHTLVAPGLAPWVGARVGVGHDSDAGVTYTGRAARIDARYAGLNDDRTALSFGLGASGILSRPGSDSSGSRTAGVKRGIPGVDAGGVTGWGLDVPIIAGYRSDAELVQIWAGLRGGYERIFGEILLRGDLNQEQELPADVSASRWFAGGLVGLAVGVRPFWVGVELDFAYQRLSGQLDWSETASVEVEGFTLAPTGALVAKF